MTIFHAPQADADAARAAREAAFEKREAERRAKTAADFEAQKKANEVAGVVVLRSRDARL